MEHGSLAYRKADGEELSVHCQNPCCLHSSKLDLDDLIKRLGPDFIFTARTAMAHLRFRCSRCGNTDIHFTVVPVGAYRNKERPHWYKPSE